ncbi:MAG: hypothetical protein AVDCRST_MAG93-2342 [uncultured Chloroflexia bacterium]|uniref:Uncharacterized protein n=1 Tax=uncultured Chloroflexia bacterium TaxID=1672391 RepID=A0A6J4IXE9_9CHLR|nr:MAG: hypothetical protein AVDCRST_MAG93-2342 [uncultured Chloroflexia bacterium]
MLLQFGAAKKRAVQQGDVRLPCDDSLDVPKFWVVRGVGIGWSQDFRHAVLQVIRNDLEHDVAELLQIKPRAFIACSELVCRRL